MTSQEWRNQRHDAVMAIQSALTDSEKRAILDANSALFPNLAGAGIADILDILSDHDMYLFWTEPMFEDNPGFMDRPGISPHLWSLAARAVIMKGPLFEEVERLVTRAQEILNQRGSDRGTD